MHIAVLQVLHPVALPAAMRHERSTVRLIPLGSDASTTPNTPKDVLAIPSPRRAADPPVQIPAAWEPGVQVAFGESEYVTPDQLSKRPAALGTVSVPYPDVEHPNEVARVTLTLFINERGTVDRVRLETPDVPAPFADAARETFRTATFDPGSIEGHAVKSQLQIEVDFESSEARH